MMGNLRRSSAMVGYPPELAELTKTEEMCTSQGEEPELCYNGGHTGLSATSQKNSHRAISA